MARPIFVVNKSTGRGIINTGNGRTQLEIRAAQVGIHKGKLIEWAETEDNVQTLHQGRVMDIRPAEQKHTQLVRGRVITSYSIITGHMIVTVQEIDRDRVRNFTHSLTPGLKTEQQLAMV